MIDIGIMQGRLSPPSGGKIQSFPWRTWQEEFHRAKDCGFQVLDWIIDGERPNDNPLMQDDGLAEIQVLERTTGVKVLSVCADYFMDYPVIRCTEQERKERLEILLRIVAQMNRLGTPYLEMPFVDQSAIRSKEELKDLGYIFSSVLDIIHQWGVTLAFETSLHPDLFRLFLETLDHPAARANYDMGNSASLGYNPREELSAYGRYVATVHVKDRVFGGGTVQLGTGDTDFNACFAMCREVGFTGPFILQAARGNDGEERAWNKGNMDFVVNCLNKHYVSWT